MPKAKQTNRGTTKRKPARKKPAKPSASKPKPAKPSASKRKVTKRKSAGRKRARPRTARRPAAKNLNVFISWSGARSKCLATRLRQILPTIVPNIDILFSATFVGGSAWMEALKDAIENADFAILCVTEDNLDSLWMNFEAGALWRSSQPDVLPLLLEIAPDKLFGRPMSLIHAKQFEETEFEQLCRMLADKTGMDLDRFKTNFRALWKTLRDEVQRDLSQLP